MALWLSDCTYSKSTCGANNQQRTVTLTSSARVAFASFNNFAQGRLGFVSAALNLLVANCENRTFQKYIFTLVFGQMVTPGKSMFQIG